MSDVDEERNAYIACLPPLTNGKSATDTLGLQREEIHVEELERIDAHEYNRTSGTGGENHGRTVRTDAHGSGRSLPAQTGQRRTSGAGGENHGCTDVRTDAHKSSRSLPAQTGQRRTSGTGGENQGRTDVIERPDQPSDAYESGRSLLQKKGREPKTTG